jgi:cell division septum initiation protein DivIVA
MLFAPAMLKPALAAAALAVVAGGVQQYRLHAVQKSLAECRTGIAEYREEVIQANFRAAMSVIDAQSEAHKVREAARIALLHITEAAEDRVNVVQSAAEQERTRYEQALRQAGPSCERWMQELVQCPVE